MLTLFYQRLLTDQKQINILPQLPGVYMFINKKGSVLYVGKAKNLKNRLSSYIVKENKVFGKTHLMLSQTQKVLIIPVENEIEAFLLETRYIKKYEPKFNSKLKDNKLFPSIEITMKDIYPKIFMTRKKTHAKSLYFGPYPHSTELKVVLKTLRRLFPFQSSISHPNTPCLYYHLNLCPCPTVFDSPEMRKIYKKDIKRITHFLQGNTRKVLKSLEKERNEYSRRENYELAKEIQQKIDAIKSITLPIRSPDEYEVNPQLTVDLRLSEVEELKQQLNKVNGPVDTLKRVECFDVSNTTGHNPTGSMAVAIYGELKPALYRKFKIKKIKSIDDFAMLQEVMRRRLKHTEWEFPDLIIVDGGKGQVSSVKEVLTEYHFKIPLIGIAKREETIITSSLKEIILFKNSKALDFVRRIRDEAHRFAISYHKKLRLRSMTS